MGNFTDLTTKQPDILIAKKYLGIGKTAIIYPMIQTHELIKHDISTRQ